MLGSIFIGLSGLNAYSQGLRQVSNNITNLNSNGFKATLLGFGSSFSSDGQNLTFSGRGSLGGNGVSLSQTRFDFSQGELRQTGRDLDLAVEGDGFLVIKNGSEFLYTRSGNFEIDSEGFATLAGTDYRLTLIDENGAQRPVNINSFRVGSPSRTTRILFADNLSSGVESFSIPNIEVFNANGEAASWTVAFSRADNAPAGEWLVTVTDGDGTEIGVQTLRFNNGIVDPTTIELTFADTAGGHSAILDFSENVTSFSSGAISTLRTAEVDGFGIGDLAGIRVNDTGQVELAYSNGETLEIGAVAIATFDQTQSLEQLSGGLFSHNGSGSRSILQSTDERVGRVLSRRIEASNVDLSQQFGDLILVQRGFQASSQVVSVSNEMIQQLFGIRGQG